MLDSRVLMAPAPARGGARRAQVRRPGTDGESWMRRIRRIHFVGIGGVGMSGIAEVSLTLGHRVSGSDIHESEVTRRLAERGASISYGHRAEAVTTDVDVVVNSATNYYNGVTAQEVEDFYAAKVDEDPERPVSWGLNSQLAKVDGEIIERCFKGTTRASVVRRPSSSIITVRMEWMFALCVSSTLTVRRCSLTMDVWFQISLYKRFAVKTLPCMGRGVRHAPFVLSMT